MKITSFSICLAAGIFYLASFHYYKNWENGLSGGDPSGYYIWIPSAFIYHDLIYPVKTLEARSKAFTGQKIRPLTDEGFNKPEGVEGNVYLNKYSMGMSVLYMPFFLVAHLMAFIFGHPTDGYSMFYRYFVFFNAVVYSFLGLLVLRKVLLIYFTDKIAAWTLGIVAFATNLYFFATWNTGMAHAALFFLFALLLYSTEKWYSEGKIKYSILTGFLCGLITLVRPSDVLCVFIPLLWGLNSFSSLKVRAQFLVKKWQHVLFAVVSAILVGMPQLLFWKKHTGQFFYYSYGNEGFDFSKPHLLEGIFGYQNGWLAYTPVMYLAILGIFFLIKRKNNYLLPVLVILPIQLYVIYSYWCWQWTNGFGARPMIQYYTLLSIPLGYTLQYLLSRKLIGVVAVMFIFLCTFLNIFQEWQYHFGMQWTELGTRRFYFSSIGKTKLTKTDLLYFDGAPTQPSHPEELKSIKILYFNDFEDTIKLNSPSKERHAGSFGLRLDHNAQFSPGLVMENAEKVLKGAQYLKISIWCMRTHNSGSLYAMSNLVTEIRGKGKNQQYYAIRLDNKPGNEIGSLWTGQPNIWEEVSYFVPLPSKFDDQTLLKVYVWNPTEFDIYLDDLKVELF